MSAAENEQLHSKDVLLRDRNYAVDIPRKQEQMVVPSPNINQHLTENTNNRKGIYQHTSSHRMPSNEAQHFSVKGVSRYSVSGMLNNVLIRRVGGQHY